MIINPTSLNTEEIRRMGGNALVPRPIILISTIGEDNILNVAPFSLVTQICIKPLLLGISVIRRRTGAKKDTLINIEKSGEFTANLVCDEMAEAMNIASRNFTGEIDEFQESGLTPAASQVVRPPLVAQSPINLECKLVQILEFGSTKRVSNLIIGEVIRIHVKEEYFNDGRILLKDLKALGNIGGNYYCRTSDIFEMQRLR